MFCSIVCKNWIFRAKLPQFSIGNQLVIIPQLTVDYSTGQQFFENTFPAIVPILRINGSTGFCVEIEYAF